MVIIKVIWYTLSTLFESYLSKPNNDIRQPFSPNPDLIQAKTIVFAVYDICIYKIKTIKTLLDYLVPKPNLRDRHIGIA